MKESFFKQFLGNLFGTIVGKITEKYNDAEQEKPMLHKTLLTQEYSPNLMWGSTEINQSVVAADIVSTNSSLPLKSRPSLGHATGKLPKVGMKYSKDEDDIDEINTMIAKGIDSAIIAQKVFDQVPNAIKGVDIRNEIMFLEGFSSGEILTNEGDTPGTAVRVGFGIDPKHALKVAKVWTDATSNPVDDLQAVFEKAEADTNTIGHIWLDETTFNRIRNSVAGKLLVSNYKGNSVTQEKFLSRPSRADMLEALRDEYGCEFHIIKYSAVVEEKSGKKVTVKPWKQGTIVATPTDRIGRLVYGTLAEETNNVNGVDYQKSGAYTLISKYAETDPLKEFTCSQARCLPVIDNIGSFYYLDTLTAKE